MIAVEQAIARVVDEFVAEAKKLSTERGISETEAGLLVVMAAVAKLQLDVARLDPPQSGRALQGCGEN